MMVSISKRGLVGAVEDDENLRSDPLMKTYQELRFVNAKDKAL